MHYQLSMGFNSINSDLKRENNMEQFFVWKYQSCVDVLFCKYVGKIKSIMKVFEKSAIGVELKFDQCSNISPLPPKGFNLFKEHRQAG